MSQRTAAVVAGVALVGTLLSPASAVASVEPEAAPSDDVDVRMPTPRSDDDGDGLLVASVEADLVAGVDDDEPEVEHGHEERPDLVPSLDDHGTVVALRGAPDSLILEDLVANTAIAVRWNDQGEWSDWVELVANPSEGPDALRPARIGVGPIWLGGTVGQIELRVLSGPAQRVELIALTDVADETGAPGIRSAGTAPVSPTSLPGGVYGIRPRSTWAVSNPSTCKPTAVASSVHGVVVHHTVSGNSYTQSDVPAIIRSIWRFHTVTNQWCDVGYNFLVDRYGGMWEARAGSLAQPVIGAHAGGYNTGSVGVAVLGSFHESTAPTWSSVDGVSKVTAFAAQKYGVDPAAKTWWRGFDEPDAVPPITRQDYHQSTVVGHENARDASVDGGKDCPGHNLSSRLPTIRTMARNYGVLPAMHREFLRREATGTDVGRWGGVANRSGLTAVALGMAHTEEYAGLIVDQFYRDVLGRNPDATGRRYWIGQLNNGMRVEDVGVYFYGGEEYFTKTGGGRSYITALYQKLLHRDPEPSGLEYWNSKLEEGHPPYVIAASFYRGIESRRDRVTRLYRRFLHRGPDITGREYWAATLLDHDDLELAAYLASSEEFRRRALS